MKSKLLIPILVTNLFCSAETTQEVVAYLFNTKGKLEIIREDESQPISSICNELMVNDKIVTKEKSSGMISYPTRSVTLKFPDQHTVTEATVKDRDTDSTKLALVVRGNTEPKSEPQNIVKLLLPPEVMKVDAISVIRKDDEVYLLSPAVKSYSRRPIIRLENRDKKPVVISLYKYEGYNQTLIGSVKTSGTILSWPTEEWGKLNRGDIYRLMITYRSKKSEVKINSHVFTSLENKSIVAIDSEVKKSSVNLHKNVEQLIKACRLFEEDCYGDTFSIVESLLILEPNNSFLNKLKKRTLLAMERSSD